MIDAAIEWLDEASGSRFFLWAHLYDPHRPYDPPAPFNSINDPYVGEIAFADAQIGRLQDALDARGLLDRTIVVVAGDHGESLGEHENPRTGSFQLSLTPARRRWHRRRMEIADFDWDKFEAEGKALEQRMRAVVAELDRQKAASRPSPPSGGHSLAREQPPPDSAWDGRLDRFERMLTETLNTVTVLQHDVSALQRDVGGLKRDAGAIREQMATKVELEARRRRAVRGPRTRPA